ncbi:4Fe-4S binding protein [Bacteroides faecis]|uniref:4Fe-4S binding protein n=1 Tax=Bacteroides faecis TaxID=674529 RepID=UPI0039C8B25A
MIDILSKEQCTGCSVCVDVCPVRAISIHSDSEGFGYPKIDMGTCIRCNLCEKKCPVIYAEKLKKK